MLLQTKDPPISIEIGDTDLVKLIVRSLLSQHGEKDLEDALHNFIKGLWDECEVLVPTEDS